MLALRALSQKETPDVSALNPGELVVIENSNEFDFTSVNDKKNITYTFSSFSAQGLLNALLLLPLQNINIKDYFISLSAFQ